MYQIQIQRPRFEPKEYSQPRKLGAGVFGVVFEAQHPQIQGTVAIKRSYRKSKQASRELEMLEAVQGIPGCIQLLDVFYSQSDDSDDPIQNLVLEFLPMTLQKLVDCQEEPHSFTFKRIQSLTKQLLEALAKIHDLGILHRDIKPDNLFLDKKMLQLKIGDFGSAKKLDQLNTPHCFSQWYRSPENLLGISNYGFPADMWATGCVIFQLFTKTPLFPAKSSQTQFLEIIHVLGPMAKKDCLAFKKLSKNSHADQEIQALAALSKKFSKKNIFSYLPLESYSFEQIEATDELLSGIFNYNPADRLTAEEALALPFFNI